MLDEFKRLALFTSGVVELTRNRAEQLVRDMVRSGEVRKDQASGLVKTALDLSKVNRSEIIEVIRSEINNQMSRAGLVSKRELERLERRVARLETSVKKTSSRSTGKSTSKRTTTRTAKTTAKKTTTRTTTPPVTGPAETGSDTGLQPPAST